MEKKNLVKFRVMNVISILLLIVGFIVISNGDFSAGFYTKPIIDIVLNIIAVIISIIAFLGSKKKINKVDIISLIVMILSILSAVFIIGMMLLTLFMGVGIVLLYNL